MNTLSQRQRINSRAAAVLYKAIDSLPLLLADLEPAQAAPSPPSRRRGRMKID